MTSTGRRTRHQTARPAAGLAPRQAPKTPTGRGATSPSQSPSKSDPRAPKVVAAVQDGYSWRKTGGWWREGAYVVLAIQVRSPRPAAVCARSTESRRPAIRSEFGAGDSG